MKMTYNKLFDWLKNNIEKLFTEKSIQIELTRRLKEIHPSLQWEAGPGINTHKFLAFSPNYDFDAVGYANELVESAPEIEGWEFLSGKPRKYWTKRQVKIKLAQELVFFDFDRWEYYLTSFNDGEFFDVNFVPVGSELKSNFEIEFGGQFLAQSELGERLYMDVIDRVNIVDPKDLTVETNPIGDLYEQILYERKK